MDLVSQEGSGSWGAGLDATRSTSSSKRSMGARHQGFLALFAARPPVRDGGVSITYDDASFLSAAAATRRDEEDPNQPVVGHVVKSYLEGESQKHSHDECVLQLDTGVCPSPEPPPPRAILDSGAACHVAGDKSLFSPSSFRTVAAADACYPARDGRRLAVAGVGTVAWGSFQLSDVLYVPGLLAGVVLVSVPQLAERGYLVAFGGGQCYVQDRSAGKIVGKGRLHGDDALYQLDYLNIPPEPDTTDSTAP